jgi:putative NADH-flavin reductase
MMYPTEEKPSVLVIGASGRIGQQVLRQGVSRGYRMSAIMRSHGAAAEVGSDVRVHRGDPRDPDLLGSALIGMSVVISCLGAHGLGATTLLRDGANASIEAMTRGGSSVPACRRLILVSAAMLFEDAGLLAAVLRNTILRNVAVDSRYAEAAVRRSGLDWTVVRPPRLTNGAPLGRYVVAADRLPSEAKGSVDRADVARFLVDEIEQRRFSNALVGIAAPRQ